MREQCHGFNCEDNKNVIFNPRLIDPIVIPFLFYRDVYNSICSLKQKSLRCASVGGLSRNPDQRSPTVTPVLLLRCCVLIFRDPENSTHRTCKFAFSPWSKYLTRLWSRRPISREGAHPFNWGGTLLVQLGGVFFDKTLAEGPSAAPALLCFSPALFHCGYSPL